DLVKLQKTGWSLVVVHGGGDVVSRWLGKMNIVTPFVGGLRVTDKASLDVVIAVLAGLVNKELVAAINALGGNAVGLSGVDGKIAEAKIKDEKLGRVGEVVNINTGLIQSVIDRGFLPIIAPVSCALDGGVGAGLILNVNGDTLAGALATALRADRLIFLTDVDGVKGKDGKIIEQLTADRAKELIDSGIINKGMIPKVEAGILASRTASITRIINGTKASALMDEITGKSRGTGIVKA
ncbi:MAG: acetylglutamate kinase, partial [Dehalococcoidia bacterium]|nr:acetylglutamate kinase [Dehalococcoidia bacterium]